MKKILNRILYRFKSSRDTKVLTENLISLSALKLLEYIFPLITLPYLARVIGVDKFGEIAFSASVIVYFQTVVDFGFNYTAVRDIARSRSDPAAVSRIFSTVIAAKIILMILSLSILLLLIFILPFFYENRLILLLTFLYIPGYILFPDWFFQAMEEMKYITFLNLLARIFFVCFVFIIIKEKSDYILQPVLTAIGYYASGMISIIIIKNNFKVDIILPTLGEIKKTISDSSSMFFSLFFPNLYTNFSVILLRANYGIIATGVYSGGSKFIDLADQLSMVLSRTFYPFLARRLDKHQTYVIFSFLLSLLAGLVLFLCSDILISIFYTSEFSESARVIKIMAVSPLFLFLMNTFGPNYLVLIGKDHILRNIILVSSLGGFILSLLIVPKYSYIGVAFTITVVWGIRGLITWFFAKRYKNEPINSSSL